VARTELQLAEARMTLAELQLADAKARYEQQIAEAREEIERLKRGKA
jgi:hypothetical protein